VEALTAEEVRVLGSLIEKSFLTPDTYPMTQNALVAACNQLSNRNPVVAYDDNTVRLTLTSLRTKQLARVLHVHGGRAPKHRHVLDEALELQRGELALLCVLLLRGAQTPGELRSRTERMWEFASLPEVEETLERLSERPEPLVARLERAPGQKESRYVHLLSGAEVAAEMGAAAATADDARPRTVPARGAGPDALEAIAALEARVATLEAAMAELRGELGDGG
jgi:uncharacterized protein YceH (UPF0502 family)